MKKKLFVWLLAAASVFTMALPASADVIWEPENNFYESHRDECDYVGRTYEFRGYEGTVPVFLAPEGRQIGTVNNGGTSQVQFVWQGEQAWGYVEQVDAAGWVPMDDMSLVYDSQQFMEDHAAQIQEVEPVDVDFTDAWLYSYPNGPRSHVLKEYKDYMPFDELFTTLYTDENGLRWGYVVYYMGRQQGWACLDAPMNEELSTNLVETPPSAAQVRGMPSVTESGNGLLLPAVLVTAVSAVTVVLIRKIPKKRD